MKHNSCCSNGLLKHNSASNLSWDWEIMERVVQQLKAAGSQCYLAWCRSQGLYSRSCLFKFTQHMVPTWLFGSRFQVPRYIVGESEAEASKEGRSLTDFRYACVGYSVYSDQNSHPTDGQETPTELPACVGLEETQLAPYRRNMHDLLCDSDSKYHVTEDTSGGEQGSFSSNASDNDGTERSEMRQLRSQHFYLLDGYKGGNMRWGGFRSRTSKHFLYDF
nr:uncharacterized protein LOC109177740 [Ipomoea batatas]GME11355.1 uncharacterized protein LOC109177740 [Ipomoea batatas]